MASEICDSDTKQIFQYNYVLCNVSDQMGMCVIHTLNRVSPHPSDNLPKHLKSPFCELSGMAKPSSDKVT